MWRAFSASVTGQRNLEQGAAGQDAGYCIVKDEVLVAVVCDGAGSVQAGRVGSEFMARALTEELSSTVHADRNLLELCADTAPLEASIRCVTEAVRARLAELAAAHQLTLHDYSCTLVGCVSAAGGGCFFHIGDGFAIRQGAAGDCVLSRPENGEYADETYFVTDENWKDHLRLTPLPAPERGCVLGLMSDGTAPFAVNRARDGFYRPFIDPITTYLREASAPHGNAALRNLLGSSRACEISSDDKTLLLALFL